MSTADAGAPDGSGDVHEPGRRSRERTLAVLALAVLGGVVLVAGAQPWVEVGLRGAPAVTATGADAAPALSPLGLALLALGGALAIAGPIARAVLAVVAVVLGAAAAAVALPAVVDPLGSALGAITRATGQAGTDSVRALAASVAPTAWPVVAVAAGAAAALLGGLVLVRSRRWPAGGRKYRPQPAVAAPADDTIGGWDALTRGTDPTAEVSGASDPRPSADPRPTADPHPAPLPHPPHDPERPPGAP